MSDSTLSSKELLPCAHCGGAAQLTDSNEMLRQLVKTVASLGGLNAESFKAHCFMAIARAIEANNAAAKPVAAD